ncbi:hypothetical protein DFH28DRAFT_897372 [Melampsora americana]|nr:hypothetical protein DFH28DRAFT_897372 [Melampsora americana]
MWLQSVCIVYIRSETNKIDHICLNGRMGLIKLYRANRCGLCYLLYSMSKLTSSEFYQNHLQRICKIWPFKRFILGVKFTIEIACTGWDFDTH